MYIHICYTQWNSPMGYPARGLRRAPGGCRAARASGDPGRGQAGKDGEKNRKTIGKP